MSAVPVADKEGLKSVNSVNVPSVSVVVPVWYLTNSFAVSPVAIDLMVTSPLETVADTALSNSVFASIAAATLSGVIVPYNVTVVYWSASSVVVLISIP